MSVNLRRFVNLNVSRIKRNVVNPVRDTVAAYSNEAIAGVTGNTIFVSGNMTFDSAGEPAAYVLSGYNPTAPETPITVSIAASAFESNIFYPYAKIFFDNGGAKLHYYVGVPVIEGNRISIGGVIVPNEEIAVMQITDDASNIDDTGSSGLDTITRLAAAYNVAGNPDATDDPNAITSAAKIFVGHTKTTTDSTVAKNVAAKYGEPGIEATVLAYLSRINAYGENTVHDYAFTIEDVPAADVIDVDSVVAACMQKFMNVDCTLARAVRNVGGDLLDGSDLVNCYMTVVMQQTVEEVVMNVLSDKLSGAEGTAVIYNTIVAELNKYVRCGLLAAGNWEDVDWVVDYEGENYIVANAGERLTLGYKLMVIPFAAMSQEDVAAHKCPPIYIAMTNAYGIRKVVIKGEVR